MLPRCLFFTLLGVMAIPGRFLPIFYAAHALSDTQIGVLMAVPQLVSLLAAPLLCNFADRLGRREIVAAVTYACYMFFFIAQLIALPAFGLLSDSTRFTYLLVLCVLFGFFAAPVYPLVSAIAVAHLREEHGEKGHEQFGRERLWGAVSWAVCAFTLGFVLDLPGIGIWIVYVGISLCGSAFIISLLLFERAHHSGIACNHTHTNTSSAPLLNPKGPRVSYAEHVNAIEVTQGQTGRHDKPPGEREDLPLSALKTFHTILTHGGPSTFLFFHMMLWLMAGMSLVEKLLFLFFKNDLHASNLLCGISVVITVVFEVPLMAYAPQLLQRFGSAALAIVGSLSYVVRGLGYGITPNGWVALLVEPLHGVTYAAVVTASVSFVAERTPPELEATGQSLLGVIHAISFSGGTAVGGFIMEKFGSKALYQGAAILVLLATVAFAVVNQYNCHEEQTRTR